MIKRFLQCLLLSGFGIAICLPLCAQPSPQLSGQLTADQTWQKMMAPTLKAVREQQAQAIAEAQQQQQLQQQQQQLSQQKFLHQIIQAIHTQHHEYLSHSPVSTEPLFHPQPRPSTGKKNPWLKPNPWADTHKNPHQGQQYAPAHEMGTQTGPTPSPVQQYQRPATIFNPGPTQQQKDQKPINIFQ